MSAEPSITSNQMTITSTNPADNYNTLGEVKISSDLEITDKVVAAKQALQSWKKLSVSERVTALRPLINIITDNATELATRTSREMGMATPLSTTLIERALEELEWNLNNAEGALKPIRSFESDTEINEIIREPHGVIACIAPWNFPMPNFIGNAIPALLAGNTMVMKYSEEIPLLSHYFEELLSQLDLPEGALSFVYGDGKTGAALVEQDIDMILFTGSFATGHRLTKIAAEKFIPIITELGGSSPGLVFADADIDAIIPDIYGKRFANCGQFCSGLKRLMVHKNVFDEVCEKLTAHVEQQIVGNPLDAETTIGPLVAQRQQAILETQINDAKAKGATILCGGKRPEGLQGAYYMPTLLKDITFDMKVWTEEIFGPALPIIPFTTEEEAVTLAHDTNYGLTAYVYTQDQDRVQRLLHDLQAGVVTTEATNTVRGQNPFGGYGHSGIGRVRGIEGFHQISRSKVIAWAKKSGELS